MRKFSVTVVLLVACSLVFAQVAAVSRMQQAISSLIQKKMAARGFAANDPRWGSTLNSSGAAFGTAAAVAVTVSVGAATAPAWITTGIAIGMGVAVQLAVDGVVKWIFGSDGKVSKPGADSPYNVNGGYAPMKMFQVSNVLAPTLDAACGAWGGGQGGCGSADMSCQRLSRMVNGECHYLNRFSYVSGQFAGQGPFESDFGPVGSSQTTGCAGIGLGAVNGLCPASNFPKQADSVYNNVSAAVASLPADEPSKPVNPALLASLANTAWQKAAAAPGYAGLPYDAADPVTQADVSAYQAQNQASYPTVGDFVAPQVAPSGAGAGAPFSLPNSGTGGDAAPSTPTNPSTEPLTNLGPDPGIGLPTLEAVPTVAQILDPIFSLFPSLRSFTVPQHSSTCPTGTLNLFGHTQSFNAHCDLLEGVRSILLTVMSFVWAFVALRITLSA
jgi:hypothetical protein